MAYTSQTNNRCLVFKPIHPSSFLLLALLLLLLPLGFPLARSGSMDPAVSPSRSDLQALQSIKAELVDSRGALRTWGANISGACSGGWVGIECSPQAQVVSIQLPWKGLGGRISETVGQLQALRRLSLHDNAISGSIPRSLGLLPKLRGLYLFNNLLSGSIPASIFSSTHLRIIHLGNNSLSGQIPSPLNNSTKMSRLNLSFNSLSGPLPSDFAQSASLVFLALEHNNLSGPVPNFWGNPSMKKLEELNLRDNRFRGHIPAPVSNNSSLRGIDLARNELGGEIPSSISDLPNLASFNVSYNNLTGAVPSSLSRKFNSSSFIGNVQLCGYSGSRSIQCPLPPPRPKNISSLPQPEPSSEHRHKISARDIILIAAGILLAALLLLCCVLLCCLIRKRTALKKDSRGKGIPAAATAVGVGSTGGRGEVGGGKLVHFGGPLAFTADDLLSGTAEIIGKSAYGTAYKTLLEDGNEVAVKRLREKAAKADKEFESEVAVLGRIRHPNLLPLRAYYLGPKGEKLLVFDYLPNGSLASFFHGRGGETTTTTIDWATRMKIATGIARGLCHLHTEEKMAHGNLTATNVLLDDQAFPKVGDAGLWRLMTGGTNVVVVVATGGTQQGYRAPEVAKADEVDGKAADVYSLGVILLELLTGKSPCDAVKGMDLPEWVASAVEEDQTGELFDPELVVADNSNKEKKRKNGGGTGSGGGEQATRDELLNTLNLALHCVDPSPAARPDVPEIVRQLEEIHQAAGFGSGGDDGTTTTH